MNLLFITGTDTGVGKTLLTGLLLTHLRIRGWPAFALKPFCAGSRADAKLLYSLQLSGQSKLKTQNSKLASLTLDQINPFYFPEPLAPLVAARKHRRKIILSDVLNHIREITASLITDSATPSPTLLIEGAGGLLAPLGEGFNLLDLIAHLSASLSTVYHRPSVGVLLVARNQLGTINHTLLTAKMLQYGGLLAGRRMSRHSALRTRDSRLINSRSGLKIVLTNPRKPDPSSSSNADVLSQLLAPAPVLSIPFLGLNCSSAVRIKILQRRLKRTLQALAPQ